MAGLTAETFLAVAEMVAGHLRLKEADRWSPHAGSSSTASPLSSPR
jgi:hypothetical protein